MRYITYTALLLILVLQFAACKQRGISAEEKAAVSALEGLPRVQYDRGGTVFSLGDVDGLKRISKDSVPWANYMPETDSNGQLGYYFIPGYKMDLTAPQIRIEYMDKALKGCSHPDSIFTWLKGIFITPERRGKVLSEEPVGTLDGQDIKILEIETPIYQVDDSTQYSGKWMAWAYADNGPRLVGFSYTATTIDDYKQGLPQFKDLVRSYKDDKK